LTQGAAPHSRLWKKSSSSAGVAKLSICGSTRLLAVRRSRVLTKDILFGMNVLSLAGFLVMGLSLTLHRTGNAGAPLSIGLMCAGTALVFFGLFAGNSSN
jgi:hypothetical protein